eukprot:gnl/Trimastix_PCT/2120.p1 GENE.gnl/Trimastix_PCT/2120~~gnl/Trimastix_PCT/2120.p1  ORF type:complete len:206 (-),score=33.74 gnl/Trimastix_PCT/2120:94-711(-)
MPPLKEFMYLWENAKSSWWLLLFWAVGYNVIGQLTHKNKRAKPLPNNWVTWLDHKLPLIEFPFDLLYLSCYVFALYPWVVVCDPLYIRQVNMSYLICFVVCFSVFLFWNVGYPRTIPSKGLMMKFIRAVDAPNNCLPSMHCCLAFVPILVAWHLARPEWPLVAAWGIGINASTVFTKQHYIVDSLSGIALACIAFWAAVSYAHLY